MNLQGTGDRGFLVQAQIPSDGWLLREEPAQMDQGRNPSGVPGFPERLPLAIAWPHGVIVAMFSPGQAC